MSSNGAVPHRSGRHRPAPTGPRRPGPGLEARQQRTSPGGVRTLSAGARHDLTDEQWTILTSLLPVGRKPGRPRRWSLRQLIDGIGFRTRTGCPWRDVTDRATERPPALAAGRDPAHGGVGLYLVARLCPLHGWIISHGRKHLWACVEPA